MPSPFPGMDSFLENREVFPNLHSNFITLLQMAIQPRLPDPYHASSSRGTWIEFPERSVEPDANVMVDETGRKSSITPSGGVAVQEEFQRALVIPATSDEVESSGDEHWETFLEIYRGRRPHQRLVTSIELLSPSNKRAGSAGRALYRKKQWEMLNAEVHLIEIDLLRGGTHSTALPLRRLREWAEQFQYHVCVHLFDRPEEFTAYAFTLRQKLPTIAIPLLHGDGEICVNLQSVFDQACVAGPYRREIDYQFEQIEPQLSPSDSQRVLERLIASRNGTST